MDSFIYRKTRENPAMKRFTTQKVSSYCHKMISSDENSVTLLLWRYPRDEVEARKFRSRLDSNGLLWGIHVIQAYSDQAATMIDTAWNHHDPRSAFTWPTYNKLFHGDNRWDYYTEQYVRAMFPNNFSSLSQAKVWDMFRKMILPGFEMRHQCVLRSDRYKYFLASSRKANMPWDIIPDVDTRSDEDRMREMLMDYLAETEGDNHE